MMELFDYLSPLSRAFNGSVTRAPRTSTRYAVAKRAPVKAARGLGCAHLKIYRKKIFQPAESHIQ
jgi:hypothetical protein